MPSTLAEVSPWPTAYASEQHKFRFFTSCTYIISDVTLFESKTFGIPIPLVYFVFICISFVLTFCSFHDPKVLFWPIIYLLLFYLMCFLLTRQQELCVECCKKQMSQHTTKPTITPVWSARPRSACISTPYGKILVFSSLDSPEAVEDTCDQRRF